jgi:RNA 2',3'-cyclic 3'-phosphodiesterase
MRLFVAVDLSRAAQDAMAAEQKRIAAALGREGAPLKWVRPDQAHLTLVFLGSVDAARVPPLVEAVGRDLDAAPFDMVIGGIGVFPSRGAPRAVWAGVAAGARELTGLHQALAARIVEQGVALEQRPFHPHLTLARWPGSRGADRGRALATARPDAIARQRVAWATLYESRISSSGATYHSLTRATLAPR